MKGRRAARRQRIASEQEKPGYDIRIGKTDGFRYIGIKPPIPVELMLLPDNDGVQYRVSSMRVNNVGTDEAHSEVGIMTSSDGVALYAARTIVERLSELGQVRLDESIRYINHDSLLF